MQDKNKQYDVFEFLLHFIYLFFYKKRIQKNRSLIFMTQTNSSILYSHILKYINAANTFTHDKNILFLIIITIIDIKTYLQCFSTQQQFVYVPYLCIYTQTANTYMHINVSTCIEDYKSIDYLHMESGSSSFYHSHFMLLII